MIRRTPLRRKTRLRARGNTSHARRPRDFAYMGQVAALRVCVVRELTGRFVGCEGRWLGGEGGAMTRRASIVLIVVDRIQEGG